MPNDDFSNSGFIAFRNDSSRVRKFHEPLNSVEHSGDGEAGVTLRILGDVFVDSVKVAQGLWRPYNAHLQSEATLGVLVGDPFGRVEFVQSGFDFRQKHEPFNGVVDGGIRRHRLKRLDNAITLKLLLHGFDSNAQFANERSAVSSDSAKGSFPQKPREQTAC
jgi:hypothetical protein